MIANAFPALQAAGIPGVQFDAAKMQWLGSIAPAVETMAVWHTTGVKTIEDARKRETIVGASARGAITFTYPALMNDLLGTKFKIVTGYPGGNEINLAMERGEVEARNNTWSSWKATKAAWLKDRKIVIIAQAGPKASDLDAPSVEMLARNADDRQLIELVMSGTQLGRPLTTNAGVPPERVAALRSAFAATMKDAEFLAEAAALNFEVNPVLGESMQRIVEKVLSTPAPVAARKEPFGVANGRGGGALRAGLKRSGRLPLRKRDVICPPWLQFRSKTSAISRLSRISTMANRRSPTG